MEKIFNVILNVYYSDYILKTDAWPLKYLTVSQFQASRGESEETVVILGGGVVPVKISPLYLASSSVGLSISRYAKAEGSISGQGTYKKQTMNA